MSLRPIRAAAAAILFLYAFAPFAACRPMEHAQRAGAPAASAQLVPAVAAGWSWSAGSSGVQPVVDTSSLWTLSPFPNAQLTTVDPSTRTGIRLELPPPPKAAPVLASLLARLNRLDGFAAYAPITVRFDADLDLATITERSVFLVELSTGQALALDLTGEFFPADGRTLPATNRKPFYEDATRSLILRPLAPLATAARFAVVLTDAIRDTAGNPLRAPSAGRAPAGQEPDVVRASNALVAAGRIDPAQSLPVWGFAFTTASSTDTLAGIASQLADPASPLSQTLPPGFESFADLGLAPFQGQPHLAGTAMMKGLFGNLAQLMPVISIFQKQAKGFDVVVSNLGMDQVAYVAFGRMSSAELRGLDGTISYDPRTGQGFVGRAIVPVAVAVPRPTVENGFAQPPYPVVIFGHGNTRSRLDGLTLANRFASFGFATVTLDFPGHGPGSEMAHLPKVLKDMGKAGFLKNAGARAILTALNTGTNAGLAPIDVMTGRIDSVVDRIFGRGILKEMTGVGRARDTDGDGIVDSGDDFRPRVDIVPTSDIMRQSAIDVVRLTSVVRNLGKDHNGNGRLDAIEGDLNGDGILDLGGPGRKVCYIGQSLGGSVGAMAAGLERRLYAIVPNVGSGNTSNFFLRSGISQMRAGVNLDALAPAPAGLGLSENTPEYRILWMLIQTGLDASEPANYAARWRHRADADKALLLFQTVPSDDVVPASSGVALARSAGLVSPARELDLIRLGVFEGKPVDVDAAIPPERPAQGALRFHPSDEHIFLVIPNSKDASLRPWTRMAQRQAGYFFRDGAVIDDRASLNQGP